MIIKREKGQCYMNWLCSLIDRVLGTYETQKSVCGSNPAWGFCSFSSLIIFFVTFIKLFVGNLFFDEIFANSLKTKINWLLHGDV